MLKPKILVLDIETLPGVAYIWSMREPFIPLERLISPSRIICWRAKFVGEKHMYGRDERDGRDAMLDELRKTIELADAVVTYNGEKFDIPTINGELLELRLPPLPPITHIDLYKTVQRLRLMSGRLQYLATYLKIGEKLKHAGFDMWKKIAEHNDPKEWDRMLKYNAKDVRLTDRAYREMRPYIKDHPYLRDPSPTKPACSRCGSTHVQLRGHRKTRAFLIQRLQCMNCGGWDSGTRSKVKGNVAN